ncbi:hypothetical protein CEY12_14190 [Chryseobacterium sp. T16E-39]|uniref:hypothetical protein n=1 Tax=Chryseobacterium sp. T16E-39 TaxID=2015076 RepID=UPI000B5B2043|nr:hypothetical protein [Chryseobacterium sp. T16E-39]ASK31186.1 hypothetical protein CEY12_14190 [Chryseobacterium sp. T16E-39]
MENNIGEAHNELLTFMMKNHDISTLNTFDKYIEFQYDHLSSQYPELSKYDKSEFVELVLSTLNSNDISEFDYKESLAITLKRALDSEIVSDTFYSETIRVLNDESVDGNNIEEKIGSLDAANEFEKNSISYFLEIAKSSQEFWGATDVTAKRNWVVWGADAWGGFVAGTLTGTLTVNPVVGYLAGLAGAELMSACVGAAQGHH